MAATPQTPGWPGDWLRGVLEMAVLQVLAGRVDSYGYAIAVALEQGGFGTVKGGTLYPLLSRLEQARHVATRWEAGDGGPGRKYYTITDSGRAHLAATASAWSAFAGLATDFLRGPGIPDPPDAGSAAAPAAATPTH